MTTVDQQLAALTAIWTTDRDGYVFLPWIDGTARTKEKRKQSYHEGRAYHWPKEREAIRAHLAAHQNDDLYFTPATYNAKRRIEQNVDFEILLWADLDEVNPRDIEYRPTVAWQTSPGRYQAVWHMNEEKMGASDVGKENHRLTQYLGADPSGWDCTQLLRVPGSKNHKPDHAPDHDPDKPVQGKLLWDESSQRVFVWEDFSDLPHIDGADQVSREFLDEELLNTIDRHDVWARVRLRVSKRVREYMSARRAEDVIDADRSSVLWEIERELADAGCSLAEIVVVIRASVWNKYAGRRDELQRLKIEAGKAIAESSVKKDDFLEQETRKPDQLQWLNDFAGKAIARPRWLVNKVWGVGHCGFIAGAPKSYKSWMALDLALTVATGTTWMGQEDFHTMRRGPVLYLQEEDNEGMVRARLSNVLDSKAPDMHWHGKLELSQSASGATENPHPMTLTGAGGPERYSVSWHAPRGVPAVAVQVQTGFIASDEGWQAWLDDMMTTHGFVLVVIDTLSTAAGSIDTDRSSELMALMLKPLKALAHKHDCAIAIVHHNKKDDQNAKPGRAMLGSVALHAWTESAVYVSTPKAGQVEIIRESKQDMEMRLTFNIPRMGENHRSGERTLWSPEIAIPDVGQEVPAPKKRKSPLPVKLKAMGPGPFTAERLKAVLGDHYSAILRRAEDNGHIELADDGLYHRLS